MSDDATLDAAPRDVAAERAILGILLQAAENSEQALDDTLTALTPHLNVGDYYTPAHGQLHAAIAQLRAEHQPVTQVLLFRHLQAHAEHKPTLQALGGAAGIHALYAEAPAGPTALAYAKAVADTAARRRLVAVFTRGRLRALDPTADPHDLEAATWATLAELVDPADRPGRAQTPPTINEFLGDAIDDTYDWIVPGLLERQDRVIITGAEGAGKSTLARQLAVQAASGLHPFTGELNDPLRVLVLDLENSPRQNQRAYRTLVHQAGPHLDPARLHIEHRLDGIDLTNDHDVTWLLDLCRLTQPDLLITGPIYKMANGDPTEEKASKPVALALDHLRAETGTAVWLEAHSSKPVNGTKKRAHEPYGWSGWMRWPEFGIWLDTDGELQHWRGMRDAGRTWPTSLIRGGHWPFMPASHPDDVKWQQIVRAVKESETVLSERELSSQTGIPKTTLHRILSIRQVAWINLTDPYREPSEED